MGPDEERFPISLYYGIIDLIIAYAVCIPLRNPENHPAQRLDGYRQFVPCFVGYAVPGYVLAALLLCIFFSAHLRWFPMGGFVSDDFSTFTLMGKVKDLAVALGAAADLLHGGEFCFLDPAVEKPTPGQPGRRLHAHGHRQGQPLSPGGTSARLAQFPDSPGDQFWAEHHDSGGRFLPDRKNL